MNSGRGRHVIRHRHPRAQRTSRGCLTKLLILVVIFFLLFVLFYYITPGLRWPLTDEENDLPAYDPVRPWRLEITNGPRNSDHELS